MEAGEAVIKESGIKCAAEISDCDFNPTNEKLMGLLQELKTRIEIIENKMGIVYDRLSCF